MLSTSFKCSAIRVPLRRCNSSATRARKSARQACAALSLMRLFASTNNKAPHKGGAELTVRGSGLPTLGSRIEGKSQTERLLPSGPFGPL
jgi:hypothetical protein